LWCISDVKRLEYAH